MTRAFRLLLISVAIGLLGPTLLARLALAAARPTYVIAFVPVNWSGGLDAFEGEARRQGEFFVAESTIGEFADVEFQFIRDRLDGVSLSDPWLVETVVNFGLARQPADRYIGLTNGDLALNGDSHVVGWTTGPDGLGVVVEAGDIEASAHELGHTYGLCDEYYFPSWDEQNREWGCPNPFPPACPQVETDFCEGLPAPDGSNSIMGPVGLSGPYSYNQPSLDHLRSVFAAMFASGGAPTPTPRPPAPKPIPVERPIVVADPALVRLNPGGVVQQLAPGPALQPDWSPDGQWVAFASARDGDLDLYLVPAAGGALQRLTDSPARESHPVWLPDGTHLLFVSDASGAPALYLLDLIAKSPQPLTGLPVPASWPALSRDGRFLAFSSAVTGDWELYRVDLGPGGQPRLDTLVRLTTALGPDISPAWSPDASAIAFASARGGQLGLYLLTVTDASVTSLTASSANAWAPRWLADGRILYHAYDGVALGVWVLDLATGTSMPLPASPAMAAWPAAQP